LPAELWTDIFDSVGKAFYPHGHPELHMEGHCKCDKVKFRVDGHLKAAFWCHCAMCRWYWAQANPSQTLWIEPRNAVTITSGAEYVKHWTVEELARNLRGTADVYFCSHCGTNINVKFADPGAEFTLMWPYNFDFPEFGSKPERHGYSEVLKPRFHAHYENRSIDAEDSLPKLADVWLSGMALMNNTGDIIGEMVYPMENALDIRELAPTPITRPKSYRACLVRKDKKVRRELVHFDKFDELPYQDSECDVTVKVTWSNINFKDGIVLTGGKGVARQFPLVSGIDFAGKVLESNCERFKPGQSVVLTGHYNGQHMDGGHADIVRTKSDWLIPLPEFVTEKEAMIIGTAGFTALMCIMALEKHGGLSPGEKMPVLVTGAAGGVGSFATAILKHKGYRVVGSVMGKEKLESYCRQMGADEVIDVLEKGRPLEEQKYAGVVDPVGGQTLASSLSMCMYGRAVSCCGLAGSAEFTSSVMPFILRGVKLLGIDSVQAPMDVRMEVWEEFARLRLPKTLFDELSSVHSLEDVVNDLGPKIMAGKIQGRAIIDMSLQSAKL